MSRYRRLMMVILTAALAWNGQAALAQGESLYANEWVALWGGKRLTLVRFLVDGMDCLKQKSYNPAKGEWPEVGPGGSPLQVKADVCIPTTLEEYLKEADRRFGDQVSLTLPGNHGFAVFEANDLGAALVWCQAYAAALVQSREVKVEEEDQDKPEVPACMVAPAGG